MLFYWTQTFITIVWWSNWVQKRKNNLKDSRLHLSPLPQKICFTLTILILWTGPLLLRKPLLRLLKNSLSDSKSHQKTSSLKNINWKSSNKPCTKNSGTVLLKTLKSLKRKSLTQLTPLLKPQKNCLFKNPNHWTNYKDQVLNYAQSEKVLLISAVHRLIQKSLVRIEHYKRKLSFCWMTCKS